MFTEHCHDLNVDTPVNTPCFRRSLDGRKLPRAALLRQSHAAGPANSACRRTAAEGWTKGVITGVSDLEVSDAIPRGELVRVVLPPALALAERAGEPLAVWSTQYSSMYARLHSMYVCWSRYSFSECVCSVSMLISRP